MIVSHAPSLLWKHDPAYILNRVLDSFAASSQAQVFFRADDIAIPSGNQHRLLQLFSHFEVPLCAAMVPAWMNESRWESICVNVQDKHHLFSWHQHGWVHTNHETTGKKHEFGPGSTADRKRRDISRGRDKLERILGRQFLPVFTPPWNRMDLETLHILKDLGFAAISRYSHAKPPTLTGLPDFPASVDLHTRKEATPQESLDSFLRELEASLSHGTVGFMLHHQRMSQNAFSFLEELLPRLGHQPGLRLCHFGHFLDGLPVTGDQFS